MQTEHAMDAIVLWREAGKCITLDVWEAGLNRQNRQTGPALVDITALTGTVAALAVKMAKVDRRTLFVFIPYLTWLSYASYLNAGVWWLNGGKAKVDDATAKGKGRLE